MTCERARYLIHAEAEGLITSAELQRLRTHTASCSCCAAYEKQAAHLLEEIDLDSAAVAAASSVSDGFQSRLREVLLHENAAVARRPLTRASRAMQAWFAGSGPVPRRALRGAMAALLLALGLFSASVLLSAPKPRSQTWRFDHIAAFSIQRSADGRVYAALTQHEAAGRRNPAEAQTR